MPDLRDEFEALMPEPVGHTYIGGDGPRHQWNEAIMDVLPIFPQRTKLYTEEQLRSAMQEVWNTATERAAKKEREECEFLPMEKDGSVLTPEGYRVYPPSVAALPHGVIIKTLAGLLTAPRTDEQFDADVQPADPVRAAVMTIKTALDDIMKHVPKAAIRAREGKGGAG